MTKVMFKETTCEVEMSSYSKDGSTAIRLIDAADGLPFTTATVWIEGLEADEVAIKNYSENEGIYYILLEAGIIEPEHRTVKSGFATLPVCRLKSDKIEETKPLSIKIGAPGKGRTVLLTNSDAIRLTMKRLKNKPKK